MLRISTTPKDLEPGTRKERLDQRENAQAQMTRNTRSAREAPSPASAWPLSHGRAGMARLGGLAALFALAAILLASCKQAAQPPAVESPATQVEAQATIIPETGVETAVPAPLPTLAPSTPAPAASPTAPPAFFATPLPAEGRMVELEYPPGMRLGDSDVVRLSLVPSAEGYQVTADFPNHDVEIQPLTIPRQAGYDLSAVARLDGVGFRLSPEGEQVRALPYGEIVSWNWTLSPQAPGQQRLSVVLLLRWTPLPGTPGIQHDTVAFSQSMDVQVSSFFGLSRAQAMTSGVMGLFLGGSLALFGMVTLTTRPGRSVMQTLLPNPALALEPRPGLTLTPSEAGLLRTLFRRYARLALENEFLSGYSGARTFLALPVRPDGRADAYTIVKIGQQDSIQREFDNYEAFVKDTLPPITARIQHAPVTVRGSQQAALQYTFIAQPGHMPMSLRQALLSDPNPALLEKLFATFGPNWWMQRRAHTFRLAEEYDRVLPTHYVLEPARGRGTILDGRSDPAGLDLSVGELVTLRNLPYAERRADGQSLSLRGRPPSGAPPLRVRWLSLDNPEGASGRITATRPTLLADFCAGLGLLGLPDPLSRLPGLLNERISGNLSTIHGDLNLENVLVGPGDFVWLIDFALTRDGHPLFDFAHLEAEIIAHVVTPQVSPQSYVQALHAGLLEGQSPAEGYAALIAALHGIAGRCLFNPAQPREYALALALTCLGALKFVNLGPDQKHLLYLTAAYLCQGL